MKLSVLIAFRDTSEHQQRFRTYNWLYNQYQEFLPEAEIVVASDDGEDPFHKTVALNRAAAHASGDLFLLADSDTWCPSAQVRMAQEMIETDPSIWVRPWNQKLKLGEADTEWLLAKQQSWDGAIPPGAELPRRRENLNTYWAAPPWLFTREQFERVGGFDERFRGWGQEDEAFCLAMRAIVGRPKTILGFTVHFFHPRIGQSGKDWWAGEVQSPPHQRRPNELLVEEYKKRVRYPDQMAELVRSR